MSSIFCLRTEFSDFWLRREEVSGSIIIIGLFRPLLVLEGSFLFGLKPVVYSFASKDCCAEEHRSIRIRFSACTILSPSQSEDWHEDDAGLGNLKLMTYVRYI
jgi:hypothetical protein